MLISQRLEESDRQADLGHSSQRPQQTQQHTQEGWVSSPVLRCKGRSAQCKGHSFACITEGWTKAADNMSKELN